MGLHLSRLAGVSARPTTGGWKFMKSFATVAALGAALALAGCGKSDDAGKTDDAGAAENAASVDAGAASGAIKRQAGNWKTQVKLVRLDRKSTRLNSSH